MLTIFELIKFSFGSFIWGLLMAIVIMALFFVLLSVICSNSRFSPLTYIACGVLGLLITSQCILICGGFKVLGYVDDIRVEVTELIDAGVEAGRNAGVSPEQIAGHISDEYPVIKRFVDVGSLDAGSLSAMPQIIADSVSEGVKSYMVRRVWWILGFIVVGMAVAVKTTVRHRRPVMPGTGVGTGNIPRIYGGKGPRMPGSSRRRL